MRIELKSTLQHKLSAAGTCHCNYCNPEIAGGQSQRCRFMIRAGIGHTNHGTYRNQAQAPRANLKGTPAQADTPGCWRAPEPESSRHHLACESLLRASSVSCSHARASNHRRAEMARTLGVTPNDPSIFVCICSCTSQHPDHERNQTGTCPTRASCTAPRVTHGARDYEGILTDT